MKKEKIKALYVSDLHMGSKASQCVKFLEMLSKYEFEELYLLGDMIDGYELRRRFYWKECYSDVINRIFKISQSSKVYYITGNHDSFLENLPTKFVKNIVFTRELIVERPKGNLLLIHGDQIESFMKTRPWLYRLGSFLYNKLLWLNWITGLNIAGRLKRAVKNSLSYISKFEHQAIEYAKLEGCSRVICGHIHKPSYGMVDSEGVGYTNTGDWVENCTALIEWEEGKFRFYKHEENNV